MIIPTSPDAMKQHLRRTEDRLTQLERGGGTKGEASFADTIRVGDVIVEAIDVGGGSIQLRARKASGGPTVILATL